MNFETYEEFSGDCVICGKPAEMLYIKHNFFSLRFRKFCKSCGTKHRVIKKAH